MIRCAFDTSWLLWSKNTVTIPKGNIPSYDKICIFSAHTTTDPVSQGSWVRYPVWQHTFVSPSAFSRRAVVSYWRKYVHEVLVNRLGGLSLPRKSVVRLTDRPDMTLDVYRGRKTTTTTNKATTDPRQIKSTSTTYRFAYLSSPVTISFH